MTDMRRAKAIQTCLAKKRYEKQSTAELSARAVNKHHPRSKFHNAKTYSCDVCGGWHLTHSMSKKERAAS